VNIIAGAARAKLNQVGYSFRSLSLPKLVSPDSQGAMAGADGSVPLEVRLNCELGSGWLEIRFYS
jgi:predicted transcriptional regulator